MSGSMSHENYCGPHGHSDGVLFGMGNPLLDIAVHADAALLSKYGLEPDNQVLAEPKHIPLFKEMCAMDSVEYEAGGATQNAVKIAQWILAKPNSTVFMGCIGRDEFGEKLKEKSEAVGVRVFYQYHSTEATGTAACVVVGTNRSLVANLAAANCFTIDHLNEPEHWDLACKANYFYIAGFFLTVCPDAALKVAEEALQKNKTFMMNLSAPFISQFFKDRLMSLMPYIDILFGNELEAETFGKEMGFDTTDMKEIALKAAELPRKNASRPRLIVFTQGADPTIVALNGKVVEYPVIPIASEAIADTIGAGDAFVGGFLAQLVQGEKLDRCIACAHYAANLIIQRTGCTFPATANFQ